MQRLSLDLLLIGVLLFVGAAIHGVQGDTLVTGSVFCDQCKDGQVTLFDYPLSGMKVAMVCPGNDGQNMTVGEHTTDMLGNYFMNFDGTPDLTQCYSLISANNTDPNNNGRGPNSCTATTGPPESPRLIFSMFNMATFAVDPLISQPAQPMSFCTRSSSPSPPATGGPPTVGPVTPVAPSSPPAPAFQLPPLPPTPVPPVPYLSEVTACPYQYWMMPQYKCQWRVGPDLPIWMVFGPRAASVYGTDMTFWRGLQGRGDPYRTLLREAITALLNSYASLRFDYNHFQIIRRLDTALAEGSTRTLLLTALRFKRANVGPAPGSCNLSPYCK